MYISRVKEAGGSNWGRAKIGPGARSPQPTSFRSSLSGSWLGETSEGKKRGGWQIQEGHSPCLKTNSPENVGHLPSCMEWLCTHLWWGDRRGFLFKGHSHQVQEHSMAIHPEARRPRYSFSTCRWWDESKQMKNSLWDLLIVQRHWFLPYKCLFDIFVSNVQGNSGSNLQT